MTTVFRSVGFSSIAPVLWDDTGQLVICMLALYGISTFSVVLPTLKYLRNRDFLFSHLICAVSMVPRRAALDSQMQRRAHLRRLKRTNQPEPERKAATVRP